MVSFVALVVFVVFFVVFFMLRIEGAIGMCLQKRVWLEQGG
jgi:hypothetical protein